MRMSTFFVPRLYKSFGKREAFGEFSVLSPLYSTSRSAVYSRTIQFHFPIILISLTPTPDVEICTQVHNTLE